MRKKSREIIAAANAQIAAGNAQIEKGKADLKKMTALSESLKAHSEIMAYGTDEEKTLEVERLKANGETSEEFRSRILSAMNEIIEESKREVEESNRVVAETLKDTEKILSEQIVRITPPSTELGYRKANREFGLSRTFVLNCSHQIRSKTQNLIGKMVLCEVCNEQRRVTANGPWGS